MLASEIRNKSVFSVDTQFIMEPQKASEAVLKKSVDISLENPIVKGLQNINFDCSFCNIIIFFFFNVLGYDWNNGVDYEQLLSIYRYSGFQATNFGLSVEQINKMVRL